MNIWLNWFFSFLFLSCIFEAPSGSPCCWPPCRPHRIHSCCPPVQPWPSRSRLGSWMAGCGCGWCWWGSECAHLQSGTRSTGTEPGRSAAGDPRPHSRECCQCTWSQAQLQITFTAMSVYFWCLEKQNKNTAAGKTHAVHAGRGCWRTRWQAGRCPPCCDRCCRSWRSVDSAPPWPSGCWPSQRWTDSWT